MVGGVFAFQNLDIFPTTALKTQQLALNHSPSAFSSPTHMQGTIQSDERRRGMPDDNKVPLDVSIPFPKTPPPPSLLSAPLSVSAATTSRTQASAKDWKTQLLTSAEGLYTDLLLTGMHSVAKNMTTLYCTLHLRFLETFKLYHSNVCCCLFFFSLLCTH